VRHILNIDQRSDDWRAARAGKLTASLAHVPAMQGRKKGEESTTRRDLRFRLALERINGAALPEDFGGNGDTERGRELEAEALAAYEARTGHLLTPVGFVYRDDLPIGCSPDGALVGLGIEGDPERHGDIAMYPAVDVFLGGVDVKVPRPANHNAYRLDPSLLVADYEAQIAHTLLTTSAPWWDVASYCPQMPAPLRLVIVRMVVSPITGPVSMPPSIARVHGVDLAAHELNVRQFLREVDAQEAALRQAAQEAA